MDNSCKPPKPESPLNTEINADIRKVMDISNSMGSSLLFLSIAIINTAYFFVSLTFSVLRRTSNLLVDRLGPLSKMEFPFIEIVSFIPTLLLTIFLWIYYFTCCNTSSPQSPPFSYKSFRVLRKIRTTNEVHMTLLLVVFICLIPWTLFNFFFGILYFGPSLDEIMALPLYLMPMEGVLHQISMLIYYSSFFAYVNSSISALIKNANMPLTGYITEIRFPGNCFLVFAALPVAAMYFSPQGLLTSIELSFQVLLNILLFILVKRYKMMLII